MRNLIVTSVLFFVLSAVAAAPAAHAMAKPRNSPTPTSPVPGAGAIQCGALYFTTGPQLGDWKGEIRGGCHDSGFCDERGKLKVVVDPDAPSPGALTINFKGKAKLGVERIDGTRLRHSRVGSSWYQGELQFDPWLPEQSVFLEFTYRRKDRAADATHDRSGELAGCEWVRASSR